jgi:predicted dehydrogenase
MELKAGIIGAGRIGVGFAEDLLRWPAGTHLQAYGMVPGVDLIAVADPREEARDRVGEMQHLFGSAEEMLRQVQLDIVSICTPPSQRLDLIEACVEHGVKAIFCEKPLALSGEDAEYVAALCKREHVGLLVNCQRSFSPVHRHFAVQMRIGAYGQPRWGRAVYTAGVWNSGPHLVDLLLMYFGRIQGVSVDYSRFPCEKLGDVNVDGKLMFHSGLVLELAALPVKPYTEFGFSVYTPKGQFYTGNHGMSLYRHLVVPSTAFMGCNELSDPVCLGNVESSTLIPLGIQLLIDDMHSVGQRAVHVVHVLEALESSVFEGGKYVKVSDRWGLPGSE